MMLNDIFWPTLQGTVCTPSTQVFFISIESPKVSYSFLPRFFLQTILCFFQSTVVVLLVNVVSLDIDITLAPPWPPSDAPMHHYDDIHHPSTVGWSCGPRN